MIFVKNMLEILVFINLAFTLNLNEKKYKNKEKKS